MKPLHVCCLLMALFASAFAVAQEATQEESIAYSKADVEKALQQLRPFMEGRLPTADGFVVEGSEPLDRFQRPYFHVSFELASTDQKQTTVKMAAKVTAWYAGDSPQLSGYRALASNGRLEADLYDRLQQILAAPKVSTEVKASENEPAKADDLPDAPDSARLHGSAGLSASVRTPTVAAAANTPAISNATVSSATVSSAATLRIKQLTEEKAALEEIARNQSHPDNLASVLASHTAVFSQPAGEGHVLFYADEEDEFPILGTKENWVHVTISGISRGWIRRSQLDLSGVSPSYIKAQSATTTAAELFRPTREETSAFPGTWAPLQGKPVRVIWVEPVGQSETSGKHRLDYAISLMRNAAKAKTDMTVSVQGVVIVFDSAEGGMVATTMAALERWKGGGLSDEAFEKQCWFSPVESFANAPQ